jgi:hypothetical protein
MKDMPGVKRILNEALREAWQEGYDALISGNPYDTEEE